MEMFEDIRPNLPKIFENWYQMQIGGDEFERLLEIATQTGNEPLEL